MSNIYKQNVYVIEVNDETVADKPETEYDFMLEILSVSSKEIVVSPITYLQYLKRKPRVLAVSGMLKYRDELLIGKRSSNVPGSGKWDLIPSGAVSLEDTLSSHGINEIAIRAFEREFKEELPGAKPAAYPQLVQILSLSDTVELIVSSSLSEMPLLSNYEYNELKTLNLSQSDGMIERCTTEALKQLTLIGSY